MQPFTRKGGVFMENVVTASAIHVELNALCLLMLCFIAFQSAHNVSQQMSRVLFRNVIYGIIAALVLDIAWVLVDGHPFPGGMAINAALNALYLAMGVVLGCVWYLYVLETLGYTITRRLCAMVMLPGALFTALNLISIFTGWFFTISPENVYMHGSLYWLQVIGAYGMLFVSLVHILVCLVRHSARASRHDVIKLLGFYIIPVIGALFSLPFSGMPGAWTCASVSAALIYMDDQDREILRDSLTGLNNRKTLDGAFNDYVRQHGPDRGLYLFMMDLDDFKSINDTLGHPVGDQALVATAKVLAGSMAGIRAIIARFGGDEFLIMGFFKDDDAAAAFKETLNRNFKEYNLREQPPFRLSVSIGFVRYTPGQSFDAFVEAADEKLYAEKTRRGRGRR